MTISAAAVSIRVLLFARYAEVLGRDALTVELAAPATVGDLLARLRSLPGGEQLPPRPLCAVNLIQASDQTPITPADEVAVLPPLAGG